MFPNPTDKEFPVRVTTALLVPFLILFSACSQEPPSGSNGESGLESTLGSISRNTSKGADLTRKKCGSCHSLDRNIRKVGPSLKGIYGKAPTISDVPFTAWDEAALDKWLTSPRDVKKSTRMGIPGISDPAQRKEIIDYLKLI